MSRVSYPREAVKVLMEPVDAAVLEVLRWPDRSAESWQLWLAEWPAHKLFVSDLGTDLTGATDPGSSQHPLSTTPSQSLSIPSPQASLVGSPGATLQRTTSEGRRIAVGT